MSLPSWSVQSSSRGDSANSRPCPKCPTAWLTKSPRTLRPQARCPHLSDCQPPCSQLESYQLFPALGDVRVAESEKCFHWSLQMGEFWERPSVWPWKLSACWRVVFMSCVFLALLRLYIYFCKHSDPSGCCYKCSVFLQGIEGVCAALCLLDVIISGTLNYLYFHA